MVFQLGFEPRSLPDEGNVILPRVFGLGLLALTYQVILSEYTHTKKKNKAPTVRLMPCETEGDPKVAPLPTERIIIFLVGLTRFYILQVGPIQVTQLPPDVLHLAPLAWSIPRRYLLLTTGSYGSELHLVRFLADNHQRPSVRP